MVASRQACWPVAGVTHDRLGASLAAKDVQSAGLIGV
jgi:hypothetical protein